MAIVGALVLFVTLVVLGGYFLYRSLPGNSGVVVPNASSASAEPADRDEMGVLYIRVIGESSNVFVRIPGGDVLTDQEIRQGHSVNYTDADSGLEVTIEDPAAVEVYVHGEKRDLSGEEGGYSFSVR